MDSTPRRIPTQLYESITRLAGPIVITGGNGMLAWDLAQAWAPHLAPDQLWVLGREELDITDEKSVGRLRRFRPALVLNAAAYTNADRAEIERERAFAANVSGPALLAGECRKLGARLVHFSTDQVFDGKSTSPYRETDEAHPSNYYGETKSLGEKEILRSEENLVLRIQWLYGEKKDRFTALRKRTTFTPFVDQCGAPTWTQEVARITAKLVSLDANGLFHLSYDDYASWAEVFDFAKAELSLKVRLLPKQTADLRLPGRRPLFCALSNAKLASFLGVSGLGGWKDPLREFLTSRKRTGYP